MSGSDVEPASTQRDHVLELISAVANGDAAREDILSALRNKGVDSLDVMIEVLVQATRKGSNDRIHSRLLNAQQLSNETGPEQRLRTVHQAPRLPFLLRGELYDPNDIQRFNGQELHFIPARGRDHILVIDDRDLMERWWQLSYVSSNQYTYTTLAPNEVSPSIVPTNTGGRGGFPPDFKMGGTGGTSGPEGFGTGVAPSGPPRTVFYEDIHYGGSCIELRPNRGYADLTQVPYTFFGTGDWNDTISSVQVINTNVTVLHEHIHWMGSTLTIPGGDLDLRDEGWNDRASSIETW